MKYALIGLAVVGGFYGLHRLALWAERRGFIYYLHKHGSSGVLGNAFLEVQSMFEPKVKAALEERLRDEHEVAEPGDPPSGRKGGSRRSRMSRQSNNSPRGGRTCTNS